MILGLWEIILVSLITIVGIGLGILVYSKNPKKKANQFFTLFTLSLLIWITSAFLSEIPRNLRYSLFLSRLTYLGVLLSATFLFYFSYHFPKEKILKKGVDFVVKGIAIIFSFINIFSNLIIKELTPTAWGFNLVFGKVYSPYVIFCIIVAFSALINFLKNFREASYIEKLQLSYLFLGLVIFIGTSIIVNVVIRAIIGSDIYYRIGNYSGIFLISLLAAAIVRYHLFGIEVILTEILVGVIGLLLIIQIFTAPTILWRIVNGAIFILFCIGGWLLIRYTFREIKRREEAEKISQAKSEFISITSHQLRTPLSAIKGYLSMVLEGTYGGVPERLKRILENVYISNERMIKLVNAFLDVSRIELGREELKLEENSIEDLISETVSEFEIEAKKKNLYLKFEKPKIPLPNFLFDRDKLKEVISNLIDNAIKYTQEGGIEVKCQISNAKCQIIVKDTGEGLTKEEISKLFESFSRGTAGQKFWTEGVGIGLYISRKFVELHKGKIWAESPGKGKGSAFYIELPMK